MEKVKLAVIGDPVKHSLSPELHNYWFKKQNIKNAEYNKIKVPKVYLLSFLKSLHEKGYKGINITLPLKEEAYLILKDIGTVCPLSEQAKAVNTVAVRDGKLFGYNTDISGFYSSLVKNIPSSFDLPRKIILVIGAGGAARGVITSFALKGINNVVIANRTLKRAEKLRDELLPSAKVIDLEHLNKAIPQVDMVINTVSMGIISGKTLEVDFSKSKPELICCDIVYKPHFTDFLQAAKKHKHHLVHGISMLIEQGALSFKEWFGEKPEIDNEIYEYLIRKL